jgi:hypothetical protein
MPAETSLASVRLVLTDATLYADAGVLATLARPLPVTALLALSATLATGLRRKILFVFAKRVVEVDRRR